jgi:dolichol kinase
MSEVHTTTYGAHHPHALVSWSAVLAGAVVAVTVGAMLNLLGVALGAAALNPFDLSRGDAEGFTAGAGVWVAIANALALFVGGFVASRAAKHSDHHRGILNGLAVWALAFLLAILIATSTTAGGLTSVLNGAAERAPAARVADAMVPSAEVGTDASPAIPAQAREEVDNAADTTGTVALWAFLTMLLGAVAAILGGRYGSRKHAWEDKVVGDGTHGVRVTSTRVRD